MIDLEEADGAFLDTSPKGLLRVNAQGTLARFFVMPGLPAFLERYPDIVLQLGEDDRLVDLVREGVDCVLRTGTLQDSSLVGRQIDHHAPALHLPPGHAATADFHAPCRHLCAAAARRALH